MVTIAGWLWMVAVVLVLVFPGAGLELAAGFEPCLWLSLTPITESCYWEPKSWVPRDPRGIWRQDSRRKHALLTSGMVSGWCSKPVSGAGTVPCGAWVLSLWWLSGVVWDESPSLVQQMQFDCIHYVLETTCTMDKIILSLLNALLIDCFLEKQFCFLRILFRNLSLIMNECIFVQQLLKGLLLAATSFWLLFSKPLFRSTLTMGQSIQ